MTRLLSRRPPLSLVQLEDRDVPVTAFPVVGAAAGADPIVQVYKPTGQLLTSFVAYDPSFRGGVTVDTGEIDNFLGTVEVVTGAGPGGGPHVQVFSVNINTGQVALLASFFAYDPSFTGGVRVAAGNFDSTLINGDELATGAGPGGGPHVKVFATNGALLQSFFAFQSDYTGGVAVFASPPDVLGRNNLQIVALNQTQPLVAVNPLANIATPPGPGTILLQPPRTGSGQPGAGGVPGRLNATPTTTTVGTGTGFDLFTQQVGVTTTL
jgi:hypothetical protein